MYRPPILLHLLVGASFVASTGCYAYLDVSPGTAVPGGDVRVTLADDREGALRGLLGEPVTSLTGRLATRSADTVVVLVTTVTYQSGAVNEWKGERVAIPSRLVTAVASRQFSAGRTGLLVGALALAGIAARTLFSGTNEGTNTVILQKPPGGQ